MCLHNDSGSSLTIGVNAHSNPNIAWSPRVFQAYYSVSLESVLIAGKALKVPAKTINGNFFSFLTVTSFYGNFGLF